MKQDNPLIWVEISRSALAKNIQVFRELVGDGVELAPMVKANAYGHGLLEASKIFREEGCEYLSVNSIFEARKLRESGDKGKIYIAGYTPFESLEEVIDLDCEFVIYNLETLEAIEKLGKKAKIHLKVETGTHRQGVMRKDLSEFARKIRESKHVEWIGVAMHFANIEDTTNHTFAKQQLEEFNSIREELKDFSGLKFHAANSAATLLWDSTHFDIARIGISAYGMWPSEETFLSLAGERKKKIILTPALTWKTRIAQIKKIPKGSSVGYGCVWEAKKDSTIAILPIGYYDGYVRSYSEKGEVLIQGRRVKIVGRICMNMLMVDVSEFENLQLEEEVVLLGKMGDEEITSEEMGEWGDTINYEVTTRIREGIERKVVE